MQFEEGLPKHFIVFAQTPKAQEQSRRIFLQFGVALLLPTIGILLGGASILGAFFFTLFLIILLVGLRRWQQWQTIPFAVNPSHPMMELDSIKEAEVMIRLQDGRWAEAGKERYRLISDDLLQGFNLVALDDEYTIFGYFTDEKVLNSHLRRVMALLNQSLHFVMLTMRLRTIWKRRALENPWITVYWTEIGQKNWSLKTLRAQSQKS